MALTRHAGAGVVVFATILFAATWADAQSGIATQTDPGQCQADGQVLNAYSNDLFGRLRQDLDRIQAQIVCVRDPVRLRITTPSPIGNDLIQVTCRNWDNVEEIDAAFSVTPGVPQCIRYASTVHEYKRSVEQSNQASTTDDINGIFYLHGGRVLFSGEFFPGRGTAVNQLRFSSKTDVAGETVEPGTYQVYVLPFYDATGKVRTDSALITLADDAAGRTYSFNGVGSPVKPSQTPVLQPSTQDRDGDGKADTVGLTVQLPYVGAQWKTVGGFGYGGSEAQNKVAQQAYREAAERRFDYEMAKDSCGWDIDEHPPTSLPLRGKPQPIPELAEKVNRERALTHEFLHGVVESAANDGRDLVAAFARLNPAQSATASWSSLPIGHSQSVMYQKTAAELMPGLHQAAQARLREAIGQAKRDPQMALDRSAGHNLTLLEQRVSSGVFVCREAELGIPNDAIRGACEFANRVQAAQARMISGGGAAPNPDTVREVLDLEIIRTKRGLLQATPNYVKDPQTWHQLRAERCAAHHAKTDLINDLGYPSRWPGDTQAFTSPEESLVVAWELMISDPELFDQMYSPSEHPEARNFLINSLMSRLNPNPGKPSCTLEQLRDFMRQQIGST